MNNTSKKTIVVGASSNNSRYSFLAVNRLKSCGNEVIAIGKREGQIGDVKIVTEKPQIKNIDTVTLYLNAQNQKQYYDYIFSINPRRVIFNPGAENDEFAEMLANKGIQPVEACTLVMLSTGQF